MTSMVFTPRYVPSRQSNGHHGVLDLEWAVYVLRDASDDLAARVAARLNEPERWSACPEQEIADAVRHLADAPLQSAAAVFSA
jgi:hypothetical protein